MAPMQTSAAKPITTPAKKHLRTTSTSLKLIISSRNGFVSKVSGPLGRACAPEKPNCLSMPLIFFYKTDSCAAR
jgi:hypothetical protein